MNNILKNTFGLAISNSLLTAVELSYGKTGLRVINFSKLELESGIVDDDCIILNPEAFKDALMKLMLEAKNGPITSRNVIIMIPEEKTFSHSLSISKEKTEDEDFIKDAARDSIPITLDEAVIDYKRIKNRSTEKNIIYNFVATQKSIINSLIKTIGESGLNVVAVDTSKNSLIRACNNRFQENKNDFMVVNVQLEKSPLNITTSSGFSYDSDAKIGGKELDIEIKKALNISSIEDVHKLLIQFKEDPKTISEEQQARIKNVLQNFFNTITEKSIELVKAVQNQESLKLNTIYLIGCHSCIPGLKEALKSTFPKAEIKQKLDYIELDETTELFYIHAIGLALRVVLPEVHKNDINLLPLKKRNELYEAKITPIVKRYLLGFGLLFGALMILTGMITTKSYMSHKITSQETKLLQEKTMNPYLTEAAKAKQQKTLLESQIITILKDAVPGNQIMSKIDSYNINGISMVNATYKINTTKEIEMRIRAKATSREDTENFVIHLENEPYYSEVISPLSNLVGKGERFININLTLNPNEIIKDYIGEEELIEEKPKQPSMPTKEQPDNNVEAPDLASKEKEGNETEEPADEEEKTENTEGGEQAETKEENNTPEQQS